MGLVWLDSMSVGITQVDHQHRGLILAANKLAWWPAEDLGIAVENFCDDLADHFKTEEDVLGRLGFRAAERHAHQHKTFQMELVEHCERLRAHCGGGRLAFQNWLFGWLMDQVLGEDLKFKSFVLSVTGQECVTCDCMRLAAPPDHCCRLNDL